MPEFQGSNKASTSITSLLHSLPLPPTHHTMIPTLIRRSLPPNPPFNIHTNPYRAQRLWPPDFQKISRKHQFRLERKYKRRAKLKWARPRWTKFVKTMQLGSIVCRFFFSLEVGGGLGVGLERRGEGRGGEGRERQKENWAN